MRRLVSFALGMLVAVALSFALACSAGAARPLETGITTPDVTAPEQAAFNRIETAGAGMTRVMLFWGSIAPAVEPEAWDPTDPEDPNYSWGPFDDAIRFADNAGLEVLVSVYFAPEWAERCSVEIEGICNPDPTDFAAFSEAAAKRYSGDLPNLPRVRFWQAWNEPNLPIFLMPQFKNGRPVSPGLYRALNNRLAERVRAVDPTNRVVGGGLAPLRTPGGIGPLDFMRRLLCLKGRARPVTIQGCSGRTRFDIWANNPYTTGGPFHSSYGIDDVSLGDLPEVPKVLRAGKRYRKVLSFSKSIPLWVTEFSWDSNLPDPGGVSMNILKKWVPEAMHQAWKAGVSKFFWLSLRDWPRASGLPYSQTYESGLYFRGDNLEADRPKPILNAFRFPFVAYRTRRGLAVWGRTADSRPARLIVSYKYKQGWRNVGSVRAGANGVFTGLLRTKLVTRNRGFARASVVGGGPGQTESLPFSLKPIKNFRQPPFG